MNKTVSRQDIKCFICGEKATCLDHCHTCGMYRGWLCNRCNSNIAGDRVKGFGWWQGTEVMPDGRELGKRAPHLVERAREYVGTHRVICREPGFPVRVKHYGDTRFRRRMEYWREKAQWLEHTLAPEHTCVERFCRYSDEPVPRIIATSKKTGRRYFVTQYMEEGGARRRRE